MCLRWFAALAFFAASAYAADWPKIDKAELAETRSKIDPEAGAEFLLRETTMERFTFAMMDRDDGTVTYSLNGLQDKHFIRVKIFNEKGRESFSLVSLPHPSHARITGLSARTIKPDGTVIELKPEDFKESDYTRAGRRMMKKTFAPAGLEVGSILEYRYTVASGRPNYTATLSFRSRFPTRHAIFKVGVIKWPSNFSSRKFELRTIAYNFPVQKLVEKKGFLFFEQKNLPALRVEPYAPPMLTTNPNVVVFMDLATDDSSGTFWSALGQREHREFEPTIKVTPLITGALQGIVAADQSDDQKLTKIHDWCRTALVNLDRESTRLSREEIAKLKPNKTASDVIASKIGTSDDINLAFAALAKAAGFDVRLAMLNDRRKAPFNKDITERSFVLPDSAIAIKRSGEWRFFDPGATFLPAGMLAPQNSDTSFLVSDPEGAEQPTRLLGEPAESSVREQKARLALSSDGTLEGDVSVTFTGLAEYAMRRRLDSLTAGEHANLFRRQVLKRFPSATIDNLTIENASDPVTPLRVSYRLKIPNYADKSTARLMVAPSVFEKGKSPLLKSGERLHPLVLPFRYTDRNDIRIKVPEYYELEKADTPQGIDAVGLGRYDIAVHFNSVTREIIYEQEKAITGIRFSSANYGQVKAVFDQMRLLDSHTLTLLREEGAPAETLAQKPSDAVKPGTSEAADDASMDDDDDDDPSSLL